MIPAALRQCPPIFRERWTCWSRRALALCYCHHSHERCGVAERNPTSEYLALVRGNGKPILYTPSPTTYLDHHHREGENICFFAILLLNQHLWRGPSHAVATQTRSILYGIRVFGYLREAKIRDPYMAGGFHKDVGLIVSTSCETRPKTITYSFEIPMYHITGMEVVEAPSDAGQLAIGLCVG